MKYADMHEIVDLYDWKLMYLAWGWYDICLDSWFYIYIGTRLICMGTLWLVGETQTRYG